MASTSQVAVFETLLQSLAPSFADASKFVLELTQHVADQANEGKSNEEEGISLLNVKNQQLLDYVINLCYLMLRTVNGRPIEGDAVIERLIELRTVLERIRPIEKKMEYHIEKLLKVAASGTTTDDSLEHKPRPDLMELEGEGGDEEETQSRPYVAPKVMAMHYDEEPDSDKKEQEKAKRKALKSSLVHELQQQYSQAPEQISELSEHKRKADDLQEKIDYEEQNMVRLQMTRAEKQRTRRNEAVNRLENLLDFGDYGALRSKGGGKEKVVKAKRGKYKKRR